MLSIGAETGRAPWPRDLRGKAGRQLGRPGRSLSVGARCGDAEALRVVFVATEVAPWSKTGGLADVMGALPTQLAANGHEVMTVSPLYGQQHGDVRFTGVMAPVRLPSGPPPSQLPSEPMRLLQGYPTLSWSSGAQTVSLRQRGLLDRLQRGSLRHRIARVVRSLHAGRGTGSCQEEGGCGGSGEDVSFVRFFAVHRDGVDHVFVEHPLFHTHASQLTYSEGSGGGGADRDMLAQARCSVLCQAALAAPALLWLSEDSARWRDEAQAGQGGAWGVQHGLARPAGDYTAASGSLQSLLTRVGLEGQHPLPLWPSRQLLPHHPGAQQQQQQQQQPEGADILEGSIALELQAAESAPVVFVANDWPAGLLPLWLDAYLDVRDEERRSSNGTASSSSNSSSSSSASGCSGSSGPSSGSSQRAALTSNLGRPRLSLPGPLAKQPGGTQNQQPSELVNDGRGSGPGRPSRAGSSRSSGGGSGWYMSAGGGPISVNNGLGSGPGRPIAETSSDAGTRPAGGISGTSRREAAQLLPPAGPCSDVGTIGAGGVSGDAARLLPPAGPSGNHATDSITNVELPFSTFLRFGTSSSKKGSRVRSTRQGGGGRRSIDASAAPSPLILSSLSDDPKEEAAGPAASAASPFTTTLPFTVTSGTSVSPPDGQGVSTTSAPRPGRPRRKGRPSSGPQLRGPPEGSGNGGALQARAPPEDVGSGRALRLALAAFQQLVLSKLHDARFVLAIHNFGFHGLFSADTFPRLGLPPRHLPLMLTQHGEDGEAVEAQEQDAGAAEEGQPPPPPPLWSLARRPHLSWMQAALLASDHVVTVSPQHARELQIAAAEVLQPCGHAAASAGAALALTAVGGPRPSPAMASSLLQASGPGSAQPRGHSPHLLGILNGIDTAVWDPAHDAYLPLSVRYAPESVAEGKARAKHLLQVRLGLAPDPSKPLFAFIGRLEEQKGADVLLAALPQLLGPPTPSGGSPMFNPQLCSDPAAASRAAGSSGRSVPEGPPLAQEGGPSAHPPAPPLQVAMLGCGQPWQERALGCLGTAYPGSAVGIPHHSEALAHLMMAGADFLVVPSRYEPCGLVAMCALRYGTVPVVAPVGGLVDIVRGCLGGAAGAVTGGRGSGTTVRQSLISAEPSGGDDPGAGLNGMPQVQLGPKAPPRPPVKTQKPDGPLGYILKAAIGPSTDAAGTRRAVATLVSGLLEAAVDYYASAPERISGVQALTGKVPPPLHPRDTFPERRARCMRVDVSWTRAVQQWERVLGALTAGRGGLGALPCADTLV